MPDWRVSERRSLRLRDAGAFAVAAALTASACQTPEDPVSTIGPGGSTATTAQFETAPSEPEAPPEPVVATGETQPPTLAERVGELCTTLDIAGFETRADAMEQFEAVAESRGETDAAAIELEQACAAPAELLREAVALRERRDRLDATDDPVSFSGFRCAGGDYRFVVKNDFAHPVGVHVALRLLDPSDEMLGTSDYPIVVWELEPGAEQGITGTYTDPEVDSFRCNLLARTFVAGENADAAIPSRVEADLTGDDPNEWFGVLLGREVDAVGSGDIDAASLTEDLRSTFYDDVMDLNLGDAPVDRVPSSVTICSATVDRPDDDHVSFVYFVTYPSSTGEEGLLRHGIFRRGSDGQWRWLSAAHTFDSPDFYGCGRPGPQE